MSSSARWNMLYCLRFTGGRQLDLWYDFLGVVKTVRADLRPGLGGNIDIVLTIFVIDTIVVNDTIVLTNNCYLYICINNDIM
jgi:hypothetical protein